MQPAAHANKQIGFDADVNLIDARQPVLTKKQVKNISRGEIDVHLFETGSLCTSHPRATDVDVPGVMVLHKSHATEAQLTMATAFNEEEDPEIEALRIKFITIKSTPRPRDTTGTQRGWEQTQDYFVVPSGHPYPLRGRGPLWDNNSCSFDCVLVAARFLDVGLAPTDYRGRDRQQWIKSLKPHEQSFYQCNGI